MNQMIGEFDGLIAFELIIFLILRKYHFFFKI